MAASSSAAPRRLPFQFHAHGGVGRLVLNDLPLGLIAIDRLELEVSELGTDPGAASAERFQRRRTRLRGLALRMTQAGLDDRVDHVRKQLAGLGVTQLAARLNDGFISVRARAADGLAAADLTFHVYVLGAGVPLRAIASAIRVHGHLPTPGPLLADRLLVALFGAGEGEPTTERPSVRGLCDVEVDLVGTLLWQLLPPSGWRLPAVADLELTHIRVARSAIEIAYGPIGTRGGELGVRPHTHQLAAAYDLMRSVDDQLRGGHLEDAMRSYRALLASSGPDQPLLLERILALATARPAWFFDGLELARQALGRWSKFAPAHAALASITLAQGDAREAAKHLEDVARLASGEGDDDQAALAALAAARLLRVLDPRAATQLYQLALEHDPASLEAADSLADRLADEQRWPELVRLVRVRAGQARDLARTVQLHLRLADVFVHQLDDLASAQHELDAAQKLAPDDPAVHEMTATILVASDPAAAIAAWREVARLADARGDHRTCARAWARIGDLIVAADPGAGEGDAQATGDAEAAWRRSLELDPLQADALAGLATTAAARNDHAVAADLFERLRGQGLAQAVAARHELALARSLIALGRGDDARASLRRATLAGGATAAEAHAMLAELAEAASDRDHASSELEIAISALIGLAADKPPDTDRLVARAAELAIARARLLERAGHAAAAAADWQRAYALAQDVAPAMARDAARTLLARSGDDAGLERRWVDAVLATQPTPGERAALLVRRADVIRRDRAGQPAEPAAALADVEQALALTDGAPNALATRRRALRLATELHLARGDARARAHAFAGLAALAETAVERIEAETAAAAAWLAAEDPAAALPHGARGYAALAALTSLTAHGTDPSEGAILDVSDVITPQLYRDVVLTLGEAAWRQRSWPDAIRAYRTLLDDLGRDAAAAAAAAGRLPTFRYRLAVAADRAGDPAIALAALRPLVDDPEANRHASPELRAQALRLFSELAERANDLVAAATALERFAAIGGDSSAAARADAVYRAGELFRRAERADDAVRCFETSLRISDSHMPALDALEAVWRERKDLERVATILGRKVAATARHPARQKPLLSRLGDLQDQLGRAEIARETHQRALEIDPMWRPSLRYITLGLRDGGQVVAAAGGLAQLAGELHGDHGTDLAIVTRERQIAAEALSELVAKLDDAQLEAVRAVARPALERAALDNADVAPGLARLRGEASVPRPTAHSEAATPSARMTLGVAVTGARSLRDAAARARADGKLEEAFATLETADHVNPGDVDILRELVELAILLRDFPAAARHLAALAHRLTGARRGDALLELADVFYDKLDDAARGRDAMRKAADAFDAGARRDATLRMLATEAGTHLAWDIAVEALLAIPGEKRTQTDVASLATALMRAGRDADAVTAIEAATAAGRYDDDGELLHVLHQEIQRKTELARQLEDRAAAAPADEAHQLLDEAQQLRIAIGQPGSQPLRDHAAPIGEAPKADTAPWPVRTKTKPGLPSRRVTPAPIGARTRAQTPAVGVPEVHAGDDASAGVHAAADASAGHVAPPVAPPVTSTSPGLPIGRIKLASRPTTAPRIRAVRLGVVDEPGEPTLEVDSAAEVVPDVDAPTIDAPTVDAPAVDAPAIDAPSDGTPVGDETSGGWKSVSNPSLSSPTRAARATLFPPPPPELPLEATPDEPVAAEPPPAASPPAAPPAEPIDPAIATPSVTITGTPDETAFALLLAAASADRDRLFAARRAEPDDPSVLLALLAHLGDREPELRRETLDETVRTAHGRALAIALHEQAVLAREAQEPARAISLWTRAHQTDPAFAPVWMPLADALAAADDFETARELYDAVARSTEYDPARRAFAGERAEALGRDHAVVSGEIKSRAAAPARPSEDIADAHQLLEREDWPAAIAAAERAVAARPNDLGVLELLEQAYFAAGNVPQASEAIGRQLLLVEDPAQRAALWRRRARMYRDVLGRDAEAYRCLKEAHACSPADPEIAYQLRTAAMVRGEWPLAASLLYREIAASANPRDRGALHLELALIYEERLDDYAQAQANYEQALAFDPTIPAVKLPLARRYEAIGRSSEAARLYEEAAASARAADRAGLLEAAARCRMTALGSSEPDLAAQLDRAEVAGDLDAALDLAHQLWRAEPGHAAAFRVLANVHRTSGDLAALTELTRVRASKAPGGDDRATAWLEVARLAEELRAHDQAARAYDLALIEDPGNASALDARGALAFRLGDFATADLIYRDLGAGESMLGDDELALRRSIVAEQLGRDSEALHLAQTAATLAPGRRDVLARIQELATRIGEPQIALAAARGVLELVSVDDDEAQLAASFALVELLREAGQLDEAVGHLERILRDHPVHAGAIETLAQVHAARADWTNATRYLYLLVPLAPSPIHRAERLYQLGEVVLTQVHDTDRADDVFLRASDLDPNHVPTLRRLLDVYWRADDPGGIVEVATELADKDALAGGPTPDAALGHALVAAALLGDTQLASRVQAALGDRAPRQVAIALGELAGRTGRLQLTTASTAVAELARRGMLDLAKLRAAAVGTPAANTL
jgi:tetratricopeptide (TPR) repeat protein